MRCVCTPAAVVRSDDHVLGVRGGVPLAQGHHRGHGRGVLQVVQDLRHHRGGDGRACCTGPHAAHVRDQAQHVRHPRVGVGDGAAGGGGAGLHRGAGGHARPLGLRLRHLPVLPRGLLVLCDHGVLHPVREQLLPDAEERRGHGGPAQVQLLSTAVSRRFDTYTQSVAPTLKDPLEQCCFVFMKIL